MSDLVIHNINISYDESDERVRNFVKYLKRPEQKEETRAYYLQVKNSPEQRIYIVDHYGNEFSFVYQNEHNCLIGLRGM